MRCQWIVRRTMQPAPGGQRRWDRAYQEVLAWMEGPADKPVGASRGPGAREAGHEGGALRSCVDAAPGAGPDGRAAELERLTGHTRQQGWDVPLDHIFRDDGYSGASLRRPGLDRLRDRAAARTLDLVVITAPDRVARNYVHQILLLEELEGRLPGEKSRGPLEDLVLLLKPLVL